MPGSLIDFSQPGVVLPDRIIVDTNLVIAHLKAYHTPFPEVAERSALFFHLLTEHQGVGLLTATMCIEVFHFALQAEFRRAVPAARADLARAQPSKHRHDWRDLYKARPDLILQMLPGLERLRRFLGLNRLTFLQPDDLGPIPSGLPIEEEILRLIGRYRLDSSDASILLEARRAGIDSIATLDADLQRARADFDVYIWV